MRIDLEQARRRAKERLRAWRATGERPEARLADAQLDVARELGAPSWPALVHRCEAESVAVAERARRLVEWATDGRRDRAEALLALDPALGRRGGLDAALVLGEADRLEPVLRRDPGLPGRPVGARGWVPLLYVCHSAFLGGGGPRSDALVGCGRLLLEAGADASASRPSPWGAASALYGAAAMAHEPRLTRLLLEAGAEPDDGESLYHSAETRDLACMRLLLAAGARVEGTNALANALGNPEAVGLLIGAGPAAGTPWPECETALAGIATWSDCPPESIALLVARGARLDARDRDGLTPYRRAVRFGHPGTAETLARLGARRDATPADRLLGACVRGDLASARALVEAHPALAEGLDPRDGAMLADAVAGGAEAVGLLLGLGVPVGGRERVNGGTALHHAAFAGDAEVVGMLLARGADPAEVSGPPYRTPPLTWAAAGSGMAGSGPREHARVADLLVEAGARPTPDLAAMAGEEFAEWLEGRLPSAIRE